MRVFFETKINEVPAAKNIGVGLGNFDGVHVGHQMLINQLVNECNKRNLSSAVYTFIKHPENILRKKLITPQITTIKKKIELFNNLNIDYLYLASFNEKFSRMMPEEFVKKVLIDLFGVKLIVVGYDYRFGYRGMGNASLLEKLGSKYHFDVVVVMPVMIGNDVASSTLIRKYLSCGSIDSVNNILGRPYSIQGVVVEGRKLGRTIGFPTANILPEKYLIIPDAGVYQTETSVKGKIYKSITNIGNNPTFNLDRTVVETHIFNFEQDIYGENIEVFFHRRIRGEKKFSGIEELSNQIKLDISTAINS